MLEAHTETGHLLRLASLSRNEISRLRKHQKFFCPSCHEEVIVKAGDYMIPHFAHQASSNCKLSTGETDYHMQGKLLLKKWLKNQQINVKLEHYIEEIKQIPDIYMTIQKKKIVFEFQCARVPIKEIQDRTNGYLSCGITPIWILGRSLLKTSGKKLHVTSFIKQFIHKFTPDTPTMLFFFCPNTKRMFIIHSIYMTSRERAYYSLSVYPLNRLRLPNMFAQKKIKPSQLLKKWSNEVRHFRLKERYPARGDELKWRTWLYEKRIMIDQLPLYVHLPTELQFMMKKTNWQWQSRLVFDLIDQLKIGDDFSLSECKYVLKNDLCAKDTYPLIRAYYSPIEQYLIYLEGLKIIKERSDKSYEKISPIVLNKHIEESLKCDRVLINQLMYNYD